MKNKFEENVASEIPKTKAREPNLPWKLTEDEMAQSAPGGDDLKAMISGTPPLRTRPQFLILLVVAIFAITTYLVSNAIVENEKIRGNIIKKDIELSAAQLEKERAVAEKDAAAKNSVQLEKKVSDLMAQKKLFAGVIESMTKRGEDIDAPANTPPAADTTTAAAPEAAQTR